MASLPKTITILGVTIPRTLLAVRRVKIVRVGQLWVLVTKGGARIAEFSDAMTLETWKGAFLNHAERSAEQSRARGVRGKSDSRPVGDDIRGEWNNQYDMPEFDSR